MFNNIFKNPISATLLLIVVVSFIAVPSFALPAVPAGVYTGPSANSLSSEEGLARGTAQGTVDGAEAGRSDYFAGTNANPPMSTLTDSFIATKYNLDKDNGLFRNAFVSAYRASFEIAYNTAYREESFKSQETLKAKGTEHGTSLGISEGYFAASLDLTRNRTNDWLRAYNEYLLQGTLQSRFRLDRETTIYVDNFLTAFRASFKAEYEKTRVENNFLTEKQNANYYLVGMKENLIKVDQINGVVPNGSPGTVTNTLASVKIPKGAIYQDTYLGLHHIQNSFGQNANAMDPVTHQVRISVANSFGKVKLYQPLELVFEFEGSERAGIYEWKYGRWIYAPTTRGEGFLSTQMPIGDFSGGTYVVMIDNNYKVPLDINFHWAYPDIVVAAKRNMLPPTQFLRPNDNITREELADMVYRLMHYRALAPGRNIAYKDSAKVASGYRTAVNYTLDRGLMTLDKSLQFNPKVTVTYADFQILMRRILFVDFKYQVVSDKMRFERYHRSDFAYGIKRPIKRAEVIFTLNTFVK